MIIKGGSRARPSQLAYHLQRTDTNERIKVLEIQSPHDNLADTFRDWQFLVGGTRGTKGLYHVNIDPDARYKMTPEQWQRSVDVLEEKLGLTGQPRIVVMHEKHGREHIHVVWQRTNIATMTLVSDSFNYLAHERASLALEQEFGHEIVPGKHAKRDRKKQPEFPRAEMTQAEWQQAERAGLGARERKEAVTALFEQSDNGHALKAALEEKGYILAQGDRRDFVIVDQDGQIHSLGRQIKGMKAKELRDFMADIDRASLPTAEQAKELQRTAAPELQKPAPEATEPPKPPPGLTPEEIAALQDALTKRHAEEAARRAAVQEGERRQTTEVLDTELREKLEHFDAMQQAQRDRREREIEENQKGFLAWLHEIRLRFNPELAAEEKRQQKEAEELFASQLAKERERYVETLQSQKLEQLDEMNERHAQQRRDDAATYDRDLARYIQERADSQRIAAEYEEIRRELDQQRRRDGPDPPTRVR